VSFPATVPHPGFLDVSPALTRALAVPVALHGIAHAAGASDALDRAANGASLDLLAGAWTVDDPTLLRLLGIAWAVVGAAFVVAAGVAWRRRASWPRVLAGVSVVSLVVVGLALWSSTVGVVVDVAFIVLAARAGGLTRTGVRR
jgi:hypothetical protein